MGSTGSGFRSKVRVVLFVEGNADIRELYALAMRRAGFFVAEVSSLTESIEMAGRLTPDLVVLDRYLPDGDGWDAARAMRAMPALSKVAILGFTSSKSRGDIESALIAGCDAFLEKPCTPDQLVRFALGLLGLPLPEEEGTSGIRKLA